MEPNPGNPQPNGGSPNQCGHAAPVAADNGNAPVPGPSYLNAGFQQQVVYQQPPSCQSTYNSSNYSPNPQTFHTPSTSRPLVEYLPSNGVYPTMDYSYLHRNGLTNGDKSKVKKPKRIRTAFTTPQLSELEEQYLTNRYIDRERRNELANEFNVNEKIIKVWFQNRRMKEKRDRIEQAENQASSTGTEFDSASTMIRDASGYEIFNRRLVCHEHYPTAPIPHEIAQNQLQALNNNQHQLLPLEGIYDNQQAVVNGNPYVAFTQEEQQHILQHQPDQVQYHAPPPPPPPLPPPPYSGGLEGYNREPELYESTTDAASNDSSSDLSWIHRLNFED